MDLMQFLVLTSGLLSVFVFAQEDEDISVGGVAGKNVRLPCDLPVSSPPHVRWIDFVYNTDQNPSIVFSSHGPPPPTEHENSANFEIDSDFGLTISNLEVDSNPGSYICESLFNETLFKRSYYLTVGTKPECSGNVDLREGAQTTLQCRSEYSGNQPTLEWFRGTERVRSEDGFEIRMAKRSLNVTTTHRDDGERYSCRMEMNDVVEECSLQLNVKHLTRDLRFTPDGDTRRVGDEIRCSASGNPTPTLFLETLGSEGGGSGAGWRSVVMAPEWQDKQITVTCRASNSLDGVTEVIEKNITVTVIEAQKSEETFGSSFLGFAPSVLIGIVVVVVVLASLIVVVIIIIVIRRNNRRKHKERN